MNNFLQCWIDINLQEDIEYFPELASGTIISVYREQMMPWECDHDFMMTNSNYEKWSAIWKNGAHWKNKTATVASCAEFKYEDFGFHFSDVYLKDGPCGGAEIEEWRYVEINEEGYLVHQREYGKRAKHLSGEVIKFIAFLISRNSEIH